ncbi:hypothetical protein [Microbacterium sp. 13-71-7]|uniref:hypothetical protein n=1 Tax=Microbacterium sp. 13-71-7 TaxID=1970399 RepID=UPI0025FF3A58|nr:hypothetical protein [Microbacterium sp. 13-71-7]
MNTTSPLQGTFLLEDGEALVSAIKSGDWVAGGFAAFSAVMDTVAAVSDPLGSLIAAGLGWLMEHLQPLKGWLNDLTGDSGAVAGFAQTWTNVGTQLRRSAGDLATVLGDLDAADGAAVQAYLAFQRDVVAHLKGAASWADGLATGMQMASTIVQVVHDMVRDALAQLVGSLISYAAELVFSLGLATPLVIEQATTRVAAVATKFSKRIPDMVAAIRKLGDLVEKLKALFTRFGETADNALKGGKGAVEPPRVLTSADFQYMADGGYHSSLFGEPVLHFYDSADAKLGAEGRDVWAMPTGDAAQIHTSADAARQTGMAPMMLDAHVNGGDIYSVHFPVDPATLRRPTVADSGGWEHFYPDPTNPSPTYGHTAVNTGTGAFLVNPTRETLVTGGGPMPPGSVLTRLENGSWIVVRRY